MAKVEIETLTPRCYEFCEHIDVAARPGGDLYCSKLWMCKAGANAFYNEVLEKYEDEHHASLDKATGLKESALWIKAIKIMEDQITWEL